MSFFIRYRIAGGRGATVRQPKIGDYAAMKIEAARRIAAEWSAEVRLGGDPGGKRIEAREAPTMAALFDRYLADHARPHKKASSVAEDERLLRLHILPGLGKRKVAEVTRDEIARFHANMADRPGAANRCLALLSKAMNLAEVWGFRPDGSNPVRQVRKYPENPKERFLSPAELASLGATLALAECDGALEVEGETLPINPSAIAAVRLLVFTGARKSEILGLRWEWIDWQAGRANLPDSKTGKKPLILPPAALALLRDLPRVEGNPFVITGGKTGRALVNLKDPWLAIRAAAGLHDVRIHDLRHSFASVAAAGGASLPVIGALLGHSQPQTTARYAHLSDDPLRAAAGEIGARIPAAMDGTGGEVVPMPTRTG